MTVVKSPLTGANSYTGWYLGPKQSPEALGALGGTEVSGTSEELTITVDDGVPYLIACVTNSDGTYPAGVNVTLRDQTGAIVQHSSSDTSCVCCVNKDSTCLQACVITNPVKGRWSLTVANPTDSTHVYFATIPTNKDSQYADICAGIAKASQSTSVSADATVLAPCWICKAAFWAIGAILKILISLSLDTAAAMAALISVARSGGMVLTEEGAHMMLVALNKLAAQGVTIIATNICSWMNVCGTTLSVEITSPKNGAIVGTEVHIEAEADNANSVSFYLAAKTFLRQDTSSDHWTADWDATGYDGNHSLWALAEGSSGAVWSAPVNVTVDPSATS